MHVCVTWMRMPCTALELPDSSEQKTRLVVRDDPPLHAERVERPSIAGCILHSFGSGQRLAARARWRRAFTPWMSANPVSLSWGATMWSHEAPVGKKRRASAVPAALPTCEAVEVRLYLNFTPTPPSGGGFTTV